MFNKHLYQGLKQSAFIFSSLFLLAACGAASNNNSIDKASNNVTKSTATTAKVATKEKKQSTKKQEENTESTATTTGVNAACDAVEPKVKGLPVPNEVKPPRVFNTNEIYWYKLDTSTYPKYKDAEYEYSLDKGCTWTLAQKSPISFANLKLQAGDVQLRVKAKAGQYNAGHIASNTDRNTAFIKLNVRIKNKAPDKNMEFMSLRTGGLSLYAADNIQSSHGRSGYYNGISRSSLGYNLQYGDAYNLKVVKQPDGLYQHCKAVKHTQGVISKELVTAEVECDRADKKLKVSEFLTISDAEQLVAGVALNAFYLDKDGFLIADKNKGQIYQVSLQGKHKMIFEFKTKPVHIAGLALNSNAKKLYVLETTEGKVYLLDLTKKPIQAQEIASGFKQPNSLALVIKDYPCTGADKDCKYSESHRLYVADTGNDLIKRIDLDNHNQVSEIATVKGVKQLAVVKYARTSANTDKTDNQLWVITDGIYRLEDLDRFSGAKLQVKEVIKQAGFTSVVALNPLKEEPLLFLAAKKGDKAGIRRFDMEASSQDKNKYAELPQLSLPQIGMPNTLIEDADKGIWYMSKANTIYKVENPAQ